MLFFIPDNSLTSVIQSTNVWKIDKMTKINRNVIKNISFDKKVILVIFTLFFISIYLTWITFIPEELSQNFFHIRDQHGQFSINPVMPKGEGIARKPPPEILEELIPPPPWTEAKKFFLEEKFHFLRIEGDEYIISLDPRPPHPQPETIVEILKFEIFKPWDHCCSLKEHCCN